MSSIQVKTSDIQKTEVFKNLPSYRQKILSKKSIAVLVEKNVNEANKKGEHQWRVSAMMNETMKLLVLEVLNKKTIF